MNYVKQEEFYGCVVASVAMISGETYLEVKNNLSYWKGLGTEKGISVQFVADSYLFEKHGFVSCTKYPTIGYSQEKRQDWIKPFAQIHIVSVYTTGEHAVVMDSEGNIKDPNRGDVTYKLSDYDVRSITGFWKVI